MAAHLDPQDVHLGVVGAGYAGVRAAVTAARLGARVTLYDRTGSHEFGTRLAAVAGGRAPSGDGWADAAELTGITVERAEVASVDGAGPAVHLADGRTDVLSAVVVATGAVAARPDVTGLAEHGLTLKSTADALAIRRELVERDRLVVVGGGPTGVQLAGEAARTHRHLHVVLLEATERLLPTMPKVLGRRAATLLARRGVEVRTHAKVAAVDAAGARLTDDTHVAGMVVWATGFVADGNALLPGAPTLGGRLVVDKDLRVPGTIAVFAAGDVAAHRDVFGRHLPMSAQIADRAGATAARNAVHVAQGLPSSPAMLVDLGWMVTLGNDVGIGQVGPLPLASPLTDRLVPVLHDVIDLRHLFTIGRLRGVLAHAPGRHRPDSSSLRRAERPHLHSVG